MKVIKVGDKRIPEISSTSPRGEMTWRFHVMCPRRIQSTLASRDTRHEKSKWKWRRKSLSPRHESPKQVTAQGKTDMLMRS